MKRFVLLHFMLFISLFLFGQGNNSDDLLPKVEKGATCRVQLDTKGKKYIDIRINDVNYHDSTDTSCQVTYSITMTSVGAKTIFGNYQDFFGWHDGHHFDCQEVHYVPPIKEIPKNGSVTFESHKWLPDEKSVAINFDHKNIMVFPVYDGNVYKERQKEITARNKAKHDSFIYGTQQESFEYGRNRLGTDRNIASNLPVNGDSLSPIKKRNLLFKPEYYSKFIGASFFTIATIEHEFDVRPIEIDRESLKFFYDFENVDMNVTNGVYICFHSLNEQGVVGQMDFRLIGSESANSFIKEALDYGFKLYERGKDVLIRPRLLIPEITSNKVFCYRKKTNHGYVFLEIGANNTYTYEYYVTIYRRK